MAFADFSSFAFEGIGKQMACQGEFFTQGGNSGSRSKMKRVQAICAGGRAVLNISGRMQLTRYSRMVRLQTT
ncbi:hypothetical protein C825_000019 [Parabacteroides sp. ASF519]|nr:hypothetical protein C825_000019 [Parabacteroides sp. ASF519]